MGLLKILGAIAVLTFSQVDTNSSGKEIEVKTYAVMCGDDILSYRAYKRMKPEDICELAKELTDHESISKAE